MLIVVILLIITEYNYCEYPNEKSKDEKKIAQIIDFEKVDQAYRIIICFPRHFTIDAHKKRN